MQANNQRTDIQVLRGLAILLVLVYHARLLPALKSGFLGVDIFFVVSGFLITGIVQRDLLANRFSFKEFYWRRAKRLLPAAYVTFALVTLASPFFLTQPEMKDFTWQLLGAVTFTGNIALWLQTGYFEGAAALKPLLHVWSLSIEEQYYLLMPALLVFTPRKLLKTVVIGVTATSLLLCFYFAPIDPGATFYLLPTRAWELGLGSVTALVLNGTQLGDRLGKALFWPALAILCLLPFFPTGQAHPGLDALLACSASLIVILRQHPLLNHARLMRPLSWLGDISYSLYLMHWPLLALAASAWVSPVPGKVRLGLVLLSLLLAWLMYRWVEQPGRHAPFRPGWRNAFSIVGASAFLASSAYALEHVQRISTPTDYTYIRRGNVGLDPVCENQASFSERAECKTSASPTMLVWGDSYSMHWVEGIKHSASVGIHQASRSTCGPFLGISVYRADGFYNREWGKSCIAFNHQVLDYLRRNSKIDTVVLGSLYAQYLDGNQIIAADPSLSASKQAIHYSELLGSQDLAAVTLVKTVKTIRSLGKRVVLLAPPPNAKGVDFGRCLERKATGKVVLGAEMPDCSMRESSYREASSGVTALLERVAREADVEVFRVSDYLCRDGTCAVELDGVFLYRDNGHLSYDGSRLLGQKLDLANRLTTMAR